MACPFHLIHQSGTPVYACKKSKHLGIGVEACSRRSKLPPHSFCGFAYMTTSFYHRLPRENMGFGDDVAEMPPVPGPRSRTHTHHLHTGQGFHGLVSIIELNEKTPYRVLIFSIPIIKTN